MIKCFNRATKAFVETFTVSTVRAEEYTFQTPNSEDVCDLVQYLIDGLKKRSKFLVALHDYKGSSFHSIILISNGNIERYERIDEFIYLSIVIFISSNIFRIYIDELFSKWSKFVGV